MISRLSDEALIDILSYLSLKEAVMTSVLSRRWRYLWRYTYRRWDFDVSNNTSLFLMSCNGNPRHVVRSKYVQWVSTVLQLHLGSHLDELRIRFDMDNVIRNSPGLVWWLVFACLKRVQRLEVDLSNRLGINTLREDKALFPSPAGLSLYRCCKLNLPPSPFPCPILDFSSLISLSLNYVNVYADTLAHLLSNCPLLRHLSVKSSDTMYSSNKNLPPFKSTSLESLEIVQSNFMQKEMEICAPNLVSFAFVGRNIAISFKNAVSSSLTELTVGMDYGVSFLLDPFKQHSIFLSQIEKLKMVFNDTARCFLGKTVPSKFPNMNNLKYLEVRWEASGSSSFLFPLTLVKAAPSLCTLKIEMVLSQPFASEAELDREHPVATRTQHKCLKRVELVGFYSCAVTLCMLSRLINIAGVSLEKVMIKFDAENRSFFALQRLKAVTDNLSSTVELMVS
ncbi:unnamed protein product [Cuscuta epithymum]|uniref:F-box domain-containing protein n=1 Tax=Cuscuta epithymum TaxID=186058 RepID=A0AAV0EDV9_9ASTE|nr:unnamed protein product [Cuscuta epithymum]